MATMRIDEREYQTVILAGFLHDIGKILMRGDFGPGLDIKGQHPQVSANFVSAFRDLFSEVADPDLLLQLVQRHHEDKQHFPPELLVQSLDDDHQRALATIVSKADNLSSAERGERSEQWQDYKTTPLMCVLERLNHESDDHLKLRFHPRPLLSAQSLDVIFPEEIHEYAAGELNQLLKSFGQDFVRLFRPQDKSHTAVDNTDFDTFFSHLTGLVYRYTWCIASNTQESVPDVSLFDHLKTTAAIATCLYRYHLETGSLTEKEVACPADQRFCLVVGDLSEIQDYIFDIAHVGVGGGVARRLRSRSLYVQLCSDVAAHIILHRLKLPSVNMIMNSGGKFYLLLPNLPEAITAIEETQRDVDRWFLQELNGELALNLAHVVFDEKGFRAEKGTESGFGNVLRRVSEKLDHRKQNCFAESISRSSVWCEDEFFVGSPFEGRSACQSCHKFPATEGDLCNHCHRDAITGSKLTRANYIAFYGEPHPGDIPVLGYSVSVLSDLRNLGSRPYLIMKLNETDVSDLTSYPAATKYLATHVTKYADCQFFRTGGKHHEDDAEPDGPATFECMAHRSEGTALLGFFKADVDRLGETFVFGLRRQDNPIDTISRITTVSRMLDLFFSGWVEHLTSGEFRNCYTVFSGGDDVFVVGPWNEILCLAEKIKSDLDRFSGNPERMTISAGVLLAKPSLPIASAAKDADEVLESSKAGGRNRLTVLGHTLSWPDWQVVRQEWERFVPLVAADGKVPSAFLYSLLRYADMWRQYSKKGNVLGLRYQPLLAYNIARNLDPSKAPELRDWAEGLLQLRPADARQRVILDNLGLIASLLIYNRRGGRE